MVNDNVTNRLGTPVGYKLVPGAAIPPMLHPDSPVLGRAEVKEVFPAGKKDKAAGLLVLEGVIRKGLHARLTREDVIVSKTTISSLRRFKDDVAEVAAGAEINGDRGALPLGAEDHRAGRPRTPPYRCLPRGRAPATRQPARTRARNASSSASRCAASRRSSWR